VNEPPGPTPEPVHVWLSTTTENPRATAHDLLQQLATSLGHPTALTHTPTGRPVIEGLHISLTHTTGIAAVAATHTGPIGIDVEQLRDFPVAAMATRWFAPTEATSSPETFLRLWTAKEAVGKALGTGLRSQGLRRRMPPALTGGGGGKEPSAPEPIAEGDGGGGAPALIAHVVPSEPEFAVVYLPTGVVLALAFPVGVSEVVLHQGTALRSTVRSRTSLPVVVRGS
jgi:4'-phosphopantetheinyl transferase